MFTKVKKIFKSEKVSSNDYADVRLKVKKAKKGSCSGCCGASNDCNDGCNDSCDDGCGKQGSFCGCC